MCDGYKSSVCVSLQYYTSALSPAPWYGPRHSRSSSFSAGLLSILSPTSLLPSHPNPSSWTRLSRWRSTSTSNTPLPRRFPNGCSSPSILTFGNGTEDVDPEEPLPTCKIQPAMLTMDPSLGRGESRSCGFFYITLGYVPFVAISRLILTVFGR